MGALTANPDEEMGEPDELLESLRADGAPDSVGRFTLDAPKALEKLRRFALPEPERYVVHMLEAAAMGGAANFRGLLSWKRTTYEFDGRPISENNLRDLLPGLLEGRWPTDHRLHPLALAVNACLGGLAHQVVVESGGVRATYRPEGVSLGRSQAGTSRSGWNRVEVHPAKGAWLWPLIRRAEIDFLDEFCPCPGFSVRVNGMVPGQTPSGRAAPSHPALPYGLSVVHLRGSKPLPRELPSPRTVLGRAKASPGDFSALLFLGWATELAPLRVNTAGRLFRLKVPIGSGVQALVSAPPMRTDLTRSSLLADEEFEALKQALQQEVFEARRHLAGVFHALPGTSRNWAAPHLFVLLRDLLDRRDFDEAVEVGRHLAAWRPVEAARYRLALLCFAAGRSGEAAMEAGEAVRAWCHRLRMVPPQAGFESDGPLAPYPVDGPPLAVKSLQARVLALEQQVLGRAHEVVVARRRLLDEFCQRHGLDGRLPAALSSDLVRPPDPGAVPAPLLLEVLTQAALVRLRGIR